MLWIVGIVSFLGGAFSMAVFITCADAYRFYRKDDEINARLRGDL